MPLSLEERFWNKVDKSAGDDGCWLWTGHKLSFGYGQIRMGAKQGGKSENAHRVSWILTNGAIPDGLWVLHRCDNPPCVNPAHLFLGTHTDNMQDMIGKGRQNIYRGEANIMHKLTEELIFKAFRLYMDGWKIRAIARAINVDQSTIWLVIRGKTWKHISRDILNEESVK